MQCSIAANTLDSQVHMLTLTFHLQTDSRTSQIVEVACLQLSDNTDGQRSCLQTFLVCLDNILDTSARLLALAGIHAQLNGLGIVLGHIDDTGARFQRSVVVIGTDTLSCVVVCKAIAVVVLHLQGSGFGGRGGHFLSAAIDCHNLQLVGTGFQSYHIGTSVRSVVAHQLVIQLRIVAEEPAFHVDMIAFGSIQFPELHIGRLQPAIGLCHLDGSLDDLVEADALHLAFERIAACRMVDGDVSTTVGKVNAGDTLRIVVLLRAVLHGQHSLVL